MLAPLYLAGFYATLVCELTSPWRASRPTPADPFISGFLALVWPAWLLVLLLQVADP